MKLTIKLRDLRYPPIYEIEMQEGKGYHYDSFEVAWQNYYHDVGSKNEYEVYLKIEEEEYQRQREYAQYEKDEP
jgi:hypothetical protein